MTIRHSGAMDQRVRLERSLEQWEELGAADVCELLERMAGDAPAAMDLERLKPAVYRLRIGGAAGRSVVLKRHKPALARINRLVVERWLPALGLEGAAPKLLAAVAEREGRCVWHIYEDLGDDSLAGQRVPSRLAAAVDLVAALHTRAACYPLLPEVRWHARDHGVHFFTASLRDAVAALEALATPPCKVPREFAGARERLLHGLYGLRDEVPRRSRAMEQHGGPDTLLHGDLWPKNVLVSTSADGPAARLIDWDQVGVGPVIYDVSTLLYQSSPEERPAILGRYRAAVARAGWRLPSDIELNALCHTAESARYAHCILWAALAVLHDGAGWAITEIMDFERWLAALRPPLPQGRHP